MPAMPQPSSMMEEELVRISWVKRGLVGELIHSANRGVIFQTTFGEEMLVCVVFECLFS